MKALNRAEEHSVFRQRAISTFVIATMLITIISACNFNVYIEGRSADLPSYSQVITVEFVITATPGATQTPFIVTATPFDGVVLLPTRLVGTQGTALAGTPATLEASGSQSASEATINPTLPPTVQNAQMEILSVQNAGAVTAEYIEIRNNGATVSLEGWTIRDSDGDEYAFTDQLLFIQGRLRVYTSVGQNVPTSQYWGRQQAVYDSGDFVTLLDANGRVQSTFVIP